MPASCSKFKLVKETIGNNITRFNYFCTQNYTSHSKINTVVDTLIIEDLFSQNMKNAFFNPGGWQSWAPGFELFPNEKPLSLITKFVPQWNCYITVPGTDKKDFSRNKYLGQFIISFRIENRYFVIASTGNVKDRNLYTDDILTKEEVLPPVQFVMDRKKQILKLTVADRNKSWKANQMISQICFFKAESFTEAKDKLSFLFGTSDKADRNYADRFETVEHLGDLPQGWESWYNHYADINEKLIIEDLDSLSETNNLLSMNLKKSKEPCVFQIDDGWETALGDWIWRKDRFPSPPENIVKKIRDKNYIPGLWLAPFIIDLRSETAKAHPDWILKDKKGKPVAAGFNPLWGSMKFNPFSLLPGTFSCLDLSNEEVLSYLDNLMNKVINTWGFEYLKLDFLYAGMLNGNHKNKGASYEHYAKAVNILTKRSVSDSGRKVCYLGCGAPFESSFNNFPLCRIGCDTKEDWEDIKCARMNWNGRTSAYLNMQDSIGRNLWNRVVYLNDPDVIFVRTDNCSLDREEKLLISSVAFMFGSQLMYSDDPAESSSDAEIKLAQEILNQKDGLYGKLYEAVPQIKNVYKVTSTESETEWILNLSEKDFNYKNITVRKHSIHHFTD